MESITWTREKRSAFLHFARFAWFVLAYNLGVVLWGAYVRATGSGAGCGRHWPLCNGEVVPRSPRVETLIEFTHRVTSGLALTFVVILLWWAWRRRDENPLAWVGARWAMFFMITESLVGASLVLFDLVAYNPSFIRALVMAVHLINTFLLLASLALTAWWASEHPPFSLRWSQPLTWIVLAGLLGVMIVGVTGAITALGDTLFPASSLQAGLKEDISPTAHFLIRLRVIHPLMAVTVGVYLLFLTRWLFDHFHLLRVPALAYMLVGLVLLQIVVGLVNIILLVPVPVQLIHLFLADMLWLTLVLLSASLSPSPAPAKST